MAPTRAFMPSSSWPHGPMAFTIVIVSSVHASSGFGRRRPRKPQPVITAWSPSPMWQFWQTGARPDSGSMWWMTPCFEERHISYWLWSSPMWHVSHASGFFASSAEKRWRV